MFSNPIALHDTVVGFTPNWATEYIRNTGDFYGAAVMLNDTLHVVIKQYSHLMEHGIAEKTDRWIQQQVVS